MSPPVSALDWTVWPLRRQPVRGGIAALVGLATIVGVALTSSSAALTGVAVLVLAAAVAPFFAPTRHRLDADGVAITRLGVTKRRAWSAFRSVRANDAICLLSPFERRSWLENTRGCTLLLDGNREEVVAYAEAMVGAQPLDAAGASGRREASAAGGGPSSAHG